MAAHLRSTSGIEGTVFHDRPPAAFRSLDGAARAEGRTALLAAGGAAGDSSRWLIVLSPTSWTADEDFDLLIDAVRRIEATTDDRVLEARRILVLATGRGTLRDRFERTAAALPSRTVRLATAWFEADQYPFMVAAADVGLSLHRSSSGLDLPMKVMDFFGAGVPVCALDYGPCLAEAVLDDVNGATFTDAAGLARLLERLAADPALVESLRVGATSSGALRWDEAWARDVLPVLPHA
jgi:beta-1,4-mannosyltransferase